jgi:hypothetical protein
MLAYHPISGKPIRILKTETHLHKNNKTMIWLRGPPEHTLEPKRFQRWSTIVNTIEDAISWKECFGSFPSVITLTQPSNQIKSWLADKAPRSNQLLFLSRAVMNLYDLKWFAEQKFINIICLEEMSQLYPHLPKSYDATMTDAMAVFLVSLVIRVRRLLGFTQQEQDSLDIKTTLYEVKQSITFDIQSTQEPAPLWLIQQYYEPEKAKRGREYKKCLEKNLACPFVDKIILLNEEDFSQKLPKNSKIEQEILGRRLKYSDVIQYIKEKVPENVIVAFSNLDIYLDISWKDIWSIDMENVFLSILRYEEASGDEEAQLFGPRPDSQDTWVISSTSVKKREWDYETLNFEFGRSGCDNAINVEMLKKKFIVANPALSLKTYHCHASQIRTYNNEDVVDKPIFMYLDPTGLHDLQVVSNLKQYEKPWATSKQFSRRIRAADEKALTTYCKMVARDEKYLFAPNTDNLFITDQQEKLYTYKNTFVTTNGLVYDYDKLLVGSNNTIKEFWSKTLISNMTASIGVESILTTPIQDDIADTTWSYITRFLPKIFRMNELGYKGDMWLSKDNKKLQDFLQMFKWDTEVMPVLPRDKEIVGFGKSVTYLESTSPLILQEDIEVLRSRLKQYEGSIKNTKRIVILQDDDILGAEDVLAIEDILEQLGYEVNVVYPSRSSPSFILQRVSGVNFCISAPKQESLFWLLPRGCKVIDMMPELNISGDGAHYAGACSLEYWVNLIPKLKTDVRRKLLIEKIVLTIKQIELNSQEEPEKLVKQPITLPIGQVGFHAHSGDSFREMLGIWAERGYIEIQETNGTPYVWWGKPGDILMYDRANFDWLNKTPAQYKKILCGNPDASQIKDGLQWSFWPRRPRLVEMEVSKGLKPWADRERNLVFYGRVENSVQQQHRSNELSKACDEFDMPIGANQPYKYTQKEYLERLGSAKFGLCLAGFGPKCNREIECMALGTVPVVAPDVDMEHYYNPPKEGIHYIRLQSFNPDDAKEAIQEISEATWRDMSNAAHTWWKENCSVDGLFKLTKEIVEKL